MPKGQNFFSCFSYIWLALVEVFRDNSPTILELILENFVVHCNPRVCHSEYSKTTYLDEVTVFVLN
jgi:hypothetical protein